MYQLELVWNREFHWVPYSTPFTDLKKCIAYAAHVENMGDGEAVKETRIVNQDGEVVWAYGKLVST